MSSSLSELTDFSRKWADLTAKAVGAGISSSQIKSVYDLDLQRIQTSGDYAMSDQEAWQALNSVKAGTPTIPAPSTPFSIGSIPGYAVTDIGDLGVGLLGLFKKGVEDVVHPSDIAGQVSAIWRNPAVLEDPLKTLADPEDWLHPSNIAKEMAGSPLLSALVPGVWDAGLIQKYGVKGGIEAMLEHPASSLLDVLPIATKGAEIAATVAKTGLTEEAIGAAKDAASFSPFDTSRQALEARKAFSEAIPSSVRRAAIYGENGMGSSIIRTLMGTPFDDETMGTYLSKKLSLKTGGSLGWETSAIGRLFTQARREYATGVKELSDKLGAFYPDHGITEPSDKEAFANLVTHYSPDWASKMGFTPEQIAKFGPALEDYQDLVSEVSNRDIAADRLATVTDPRTGAAEIRALDGNDGKVVRAATRAATLADKARDVTDRMGAIMDYPFRGDPAQAIKEWFGSKILNQTRAFEQISTKEVELADQLFDKPFTRDDWEKVSKLFGNKGKFAKLRAHVAADNLKAARADVRSILGTLKGAYAKSNPALRRIDEQLRTAQDMLREYAKGSKTIEDAKAATARAESLMDRYPEARFAPRMTELVADGLMKHLQGSNVTPEDFGLLEDMLMNGVWKGEKFGDLIGAKAFSQIRQSAVQTLIEERAAGLDPVWVPSIHSTEIPKLGQAGIDIERISKSRSLKSRAAVNPAAVYEPILGLRRRIAEDLEEKAMTELFYGAGGIKARWGNTFDDAVTQAIQFAKGVPLDATRAARSHVVQDWIMDNFQEINPRDYISSGSVKAIGLGKVPKDSFLVPKTIAKSLEANIKATRGPQNFASRTFMEGTEVFRYSLLNFSPRYQAHSWFGSGAFSLLSLGPQSFRHIPAALGMAIQDSDLMTSFAKSAHFGAFKPVLDFFKARAERQGETGGLNPRITHGIAEANPDLIKEWQYGTGGKIGTWLKQAMENRGLSAGLEMAALGQNMWKAVAYLEGKSKGGVEEGIRTALKVYADMDGLTPFERSLTRFGIPFYSWTRHVLRYALELPMDHPLRAAVLSRMVNQEWEDWPTGLPQDLVYLFQLGGTDAAGNAKVVDIRQLDPLRSVDSVFTMAGFVGSLNPLFQNVALPALGINPQTADPMDPYPTMTLNQFYGTEQAQRPNPLEVIAQGIEGYVPEAGVIDHFLKLSANTRWAAQNDPTSYRNELYQSLNFPWVPYNVNLQQTVAESENHDYSIASAAATAALADPNPNDSAWTSLIHDYAYVPYSGWLVQPASLRKWAFDQVVSAGYWDNATNQSSLPPSNVIVPPKAPKL